MAFNKHYMHVNILIIFQAGIEGVLLRLFEKNEAQGLPKLSVKNNLDWFGDMKFLTFLREVGKFARVGTMLGKESVGGDPIRQKN